MADLIQPILHEMILASLEATRLRMIPDTHLRLFPAPFVGSPEPVMFFLDEIQTVPGWETVACGCFMRATDRAQTRANTHLDMRSLPSLHSIAFLSVGFSPLWTLAIVLGHSWAAQVQLLGDCLDRKDHFFP
ncbi:MAG: hypothetical protein O2960_29560 [Verrucomicrobia bacterium]|nr:hypothetical protein [Verrucomicrobiota bacterium]